MCSSTRTIAVAALAAAFALLASSARAGDPGNRIRQKRDRDTYPRIGEIAPSNPENPPSDGTKHYQLETELGDKDNTETAYVKLRVKRATIRGEGEIKTNDPTKIVDREKEAWGADEVAIEIGGTSEETFDMTVSNPITFTASWALSPGMFVYAVGQMWAIDIAGGRHEYKLDVAVGGTSKTERKSSDTVEETNENVSGWQVSGHAGTTSRQVSAGGSSKDTTKTGTQSTDSKGESSTSGSPVVGNGGYACTVTQKESGACPHSCPPRKIASYSHLSIGAMAQSEEREVMVRVRPWDVTNNINVSVIIYTPSLRGGPVLTTHHDEEAASLGMPDDGSGNGGLVAVASLSDVVATLYVPRGSNGLQSEAGYRSGEFAITLSSPAPADLCFSLASDAAISFTDNPLIVPAGSDTGRAAFRALSSGTSTVTATLLDESGAPTSDALVVAVEHKSFADCATPELEASLDAWADGGGRYVGSVLGYLGRIRVVRSRFAGYDALGTSFTVSVTDSSGILASMPNSVTIAAGESDAELPVVFGGNCGVATITVASGGFQRSFEVESRVPQLSAPAAMTIPLGATMPVRVEFGSPATAPTTVTGASAAPAVVSVGSPSTNAVSGGHTATTFKVTAQSVGSTNVSFASSGLGSASTLVTVSPPWLSITPTALTVSQLSPGRSGTIRIECPVGGTFQSAAVAPADVGLISARILGQRTLVLEFVHVPESVASFTLSCATAGCGPGDLVSVTDTHHVEDATVAYALEIE